MNNNAPRGHASHRLILKNWKAEQMGTKMTIDTIERSMMNAASEGVSDTIGYTKAPRRWRRSRCNRMDSNGRAGHCTKK